MPPAVVVVCPVGADAGHVEAAGVGVADAVGEAVAAAEAVGEAEAAADALAVGEAAGVGVADAAALAVGVGVAVDGTTGPAGASGRPEPPPVHPAIVKAKSNAQPARNMQLSRLCARPRACLRW